MLERLRLGATTQQTHGGITDQIGSHDVVEQFGFEKYQDARSQSEERAGLEWIWHVLTLGIIGWRGLRIIGYPEKKHMESRYVWQAGLSCP